MDRLIIAVLGNSDAGKSHTWNVLFGTTVKTGKHKRPLEVADGQYVDVFLASGSPEERKIYVGDIIVNEKARIVLCSVQYLKSANTTFDYFIDNNFDLAVQWLNPGYHDSRAGPDYLGLFTYLQHQRSLMAIRDGKLPAESRVEELRQILHGWAAARGLVYSA